MRKLLLSLCLALTPLCYGQAPPAQAIAAGYTTLVWNPQSTTPTICPSNASTNCTVYSPGSVYTALQGPVSLSGNTIVEQWTAAPLGSVTGISGDTFTGSGTLLLTNFNTCTGATATVTITSGSFTSAAITNAASCAGQPTTATCTSGTAVCVGSPLSITVATTLAQFGVTNLTSDNGPPNTGSTLGLWWTYGYFEASICFDADTGNWPALWQKTKTNTPYTGPEFDWFEWQSNTPNTFTGTAHVWSNGSSLGQLQVTGTVSGQTAGCPNYMIAGFLWTPTTVSWWFNNAQVGTTQSTTGSPYSSYFAGQYPMNIILSEQFGCNFVGGVCTGATGPFTMKVQWIHVFQSGSAGGVRAKGFTRGVL